VPLPFPHQDFLGMEEVEEKSYKEFISLQKHRRDEIK